MIEEFHNNAPIYIQIMNEIKVRIVSGVLQPNEKMGSIRELAQEFGVNPNTMQRALAELEKEKLLYTERTSGKYITSDEDLITNIRHILAEKEVIKFLHDMKSLGYSSHEIVEKIKDQCEMAVGTWEK